MWQCVMGLVLSCMLRISAMKVQTSHGPIEGKEITVFSGAKGVAFLGVPYAAPPIGELRFALPKPPKPWNQTLQTKKLSKGCTQFVTDEMRNTMWFVSDQPDSEDCLYLNIWKPATTTGNKAIMIWIHGGSFVAGSANMELYDGSILSVLHDVIVVSVNYRLAMFGFLFLNDSDVTGNAGMQDQILAIKWVKKNAKAFGGDPAKITLFGESAGAACVSAHLINKDVRPLFNNAILQSGVISAPSKRYSIKEAMQTSLDLAKNTGCLSDSPQNTLTCLRNVSLSALLNKNNKDGYGPIKNGIEVPVDMNTISDLVPINERKNILEGNVPNELAFLISRYIPGKQFTEDVTVSTEDIEVVMENIFKLQDERLQSIVTHEYKDFDSQTKSTDLRVEATTAISDLLMFCPQIKFTEQWLTDDNKIYYYYFNHKPSKPLKFEVPSWADIIHGDELPFVFGRPFQPKYGYSQQDKMLSKIMMILWTNFAKTGDPSWNKLKWPALSPDGKFTHVEFNNGTNVKNLLRNKQCDFWFNVYPNLVSIQQQLEKEAN